MTESSIKHNDKDSIVLREPCFGLNSNIFEDLKI